MLSEDDKADRPGLAFEGEDVVDLYKFRPPYPQEMYAHILANVSDKNHLLDLGCGHGKIARRMIGEFEVVSAVDPSNAMITLGKSMPEGDADNLIWINELAEKALISGPKVNLVTAALSLHWMDQDRLFAHLEPFLETGCVFAHIAGDSATDPAWQTGWVSFLTRWVPRLTGKAFEYRSPSGFWTGNETFLKVFDKKRFLSPPIRQTMEDFILCQHSRDTSAPSKLGDQRDRFDAELRELLMPFTDSAGVLEFQVETSLTLARFKA